MLSTNIGFNRRDEYTLHVRRVSCFREAVDWLAGWICHFTGHRIERLYGKVANWAWRGQTEILQRTITRDEAFAMYPDFVTRQEEDDCGLRGQEAR